jgi:drug/metabolite transporter (DMT)-like permease
MKERRPLALFTVVSVVWGVPYLLIKVADRGLSPAVIVEGRTLLGGLLLLPLALREGRISELWKVRIPLVAYCVCELGVPWLLLTTAEQRLSSSLTGLLIAMVPLISALLALITNHHRVRGRRAVFGMLLGLAGVGLLLGLDVGSAATTSLLMVLVVVVGYATGPLVVSRYMNACSSLALSAVSLLLVAAVYLPFSLHEGPHRFPAATVLLSVVGLGVICTAIAFVAFFELIKVMAPTHATLVTYFNPVVAVILGAAVLGESVHPAAVAGFGLILTGSWFATGRRDRRETDTPSLRTSGRLDAGERRSRRRRSTGP